MAYRPPSKSQTPANPPASKSWGTKKEVKKELDLTRDFPSLGASPKTLAPSQGPQGKTFAERMKEQLAIEAEKKRIEEEEKAKREQLEKENAVINSIQFVSFYRNRRKVSIHDDYVEDEQELCDGYECEEVDDVEVEPINQEEEFEEV